MSGAAAPPRARADAALTLARLQRRAQQLAKLPPCQASCPGGGDVRGWIGIVAQRQKLGLTLDEALRRAWHEIVLRNPFPATMGRICPHPCETGCNRNAKDGAVAVHALERYLGDWALERGLKLPPTGEGPWPESIGVVGAGPAGLSFAYQMARRGYAVEIYERESEPGGMLLRGIPSYRLPKRVLRSEIQRILDFGVVLRLACGVGREASLAELRERHAVLFLGIGAQAGQRLGISGEWGEGCFTGVDYLRRVHEGRPPALGGRVAVIGGGNTAIDTARSARRADSEVVLLYRRTRDEMPANAEEIADALEEGVVLEQLVAPLAIRRESGAIRGLTLQRMRLGKADESGRRRPEPIPGDTRELAVDAVIAAVSQTPDWTGVDDRSEPFGGAKPGGDGEIDGFWTGGDARGLGIATSAVAQGRTAAEAVHARLRSLPRPTPAVRSPIAPSRIRLETYPDRPRTAAKKLPPARRLERPADEVAATIEPSEFLAEAARCLSCGSCFGCAQCFIYCNPGGISRVDPIAPGAYFAFDLEACEGCGKCIEVCPCAFLEAR